jgi:NAD(P)-dependent dehydrogenase (short-subunit alcohol dehydrogenase family)
VNSDPREVDLNGQVALITGGGRGLGRAFAETLAAAGAAVAVVARSAGEVEESAAAIIARGGQALAPAADVSDPAAVERVVRDVERQLGPVNLLINNAAVSGPIGPITETDPEQWWRCLEINLRGPFLCARAVLPGMIARARGRIINVASGAGAMPVPYLGAYVTSKAALIRLTENLALESREHGISVFAIHPGTVRTTMVTEGMDTPAGRQWIPWFRDAIVDGQYVPPECAAHLVLQLASGRADPLTGRFLTIHQDLNALIARADEIVAADRYTLRVREEG